MTGSEPYPEEPEDRSAVRENEARMRDLKEVGLSHREAEVLALLEAGYQRRQVASILDLSPSTISTYRDRVIEERERARRLLEELEASSAIAGVSGDSS